jgi:hypothetical protein
MISSCSLIFKNAEKRAPARVVNALGEMLMLHHPRHVQVFDTNTTVLLRIVFGGLEVKVPALATDLEVLAGDFPIRLAAAMTPLLAAAHRALLMRQSLLAQAIMARILNYRAFGVGQEHLQAHVQPDSGMLACRLRRRLRMRRALLILRRRLADDQRIPVVVGAQDQMGGDRRSQ